MCPGRSTVKTSRGPKRLFACVLPGLRFVGPKQTAYFLLPTITIYPGWRRQNDRPSQRPTQRPTDFACGEKATRAGIAVGSPAAPPHAGWRRRRPCSDWLSACSLPLPLAAPATTGKRCPRRRPQAEAGSAETPSTACPIYVHIAIYFLIYSMPACFFGVNVSTIYRDICLASAT